MKDSTNKRNVEANIPHEYRCKNVNRNIKYLKILN